MVNTLSFGLQEKRNQFTVIMRDNNIVFLAFVDAEYKYKIYFCGY